MLYNLELDITTAQRDHLKAVLDDSPNVPGSGELYRIIFPSLTETQKLTIIKQLEGEETSEKIDEEFLVQAAKDFQQMLEDVEREERENEKKPTRNITDITGAWLPESYVNVDLGGLFANLKSDNSYVLTIVDASNTIFTVENYKSEQVVTSTFSTSAVFLLPKFVKQITTAVILQKEAQPDAPLEIPQPGPTGIPYLVEPPKGLNGPNK